MVIPFDESLLTINYMLYDFTPENGFIQVYDNNEWISLF